jgi:hypothetical protein
MHLGSTHRESRGEEGFNHSQLGFEERCGYIDRKYSGQDKRTKVIEMDSPCHAEWYRYVLRHNHAVEVTEKIPEVYQLYYDDYTDNYSGAVEKLLDFLELETVHDCEPLHFEANKTYLEYFSADHRQKAARFVRGVASVKAWKLLSRYFEPYLVEDSTISSPPQQKEPVGRRRPSGARRGLVESRAARSLHIQPTDEVVL